MWPEAAQPQQDAECKPYGDLRNAKWLDPECYGAGACQSLKFKAAQQPAQPVALTERAAFEAWAGDQGYPMRRIHAGEDDSGYLDLRTEGAWGAWMARAAQQPAQPVAKQLSRGQIGDIVREHLRGLYYCGRVWEAWSVGTMSEDDFSPAEELDTADEIADSLWAGMTQASWAAQPPAQPDKEHNHE
jgi:hypothetical protein